MCDCTECSTDLLIVSLQIKIFWNNMVKLIPRANNNCFEMLDFLQELNELYITYPEHSPETT